MEAQKRMYGNYEIIQSCTISGVEVVIGYNPYAPSPYVCWYCEMVQSIFGVTTVAAWNRFNRHFKSDVGVKKKD